LVASNWYVELACTVVGVDEEPTVIDTLVLAEFPPESVSETVMT